MAIGVPDSGTAEQVRTELIQATKEHLLTLEDDAVVVVHRSDGRIKLRQGREPEQVSAQPALVTGA